MMGRLGLILMMPIVIPIIAMLYLGTYLLDGIIKLRKVFGHG